MGPRQTMRIAVIGLLLTGLLGACGGGGDDHDAGSATEDGTSPATDSTAEQEASATAVTGEETATTSDGGDDNGSGDNGGGEDNGGGGDDEQQGNDELDSVQWGPDSPPVPEQYLAWSPSEDGSLRCELVPDDGVDTFWGLARRICLALTGQADWPTIDAVPPPAPNDSPYHACLDGELAALLERALTWHAEHPGGTADLALPGPGTHSPCQRSLYAISVSTDDESNTCDGQLPLPTDAHRADRSRRPTGRERSGGERARGAVLRSPGLPGHRHPAVAHHRGRAERAPPTSPSTSRPTTGR